MMAGQFSSAVQHRVLLIDKLKIQFIRKFNRKVREGRSPNYAGFQTVLEHCWSRSTFHNS